MYAAARSSEWDAPISRALRLGHRNNVNRLVCAAARSLEHCATFGSMLWLGLRHLVYIVFVNITMP